MARITKDSAAPSDAEHFSLGNVEFDLKRKNSVYETNDPAVLANARVHPYLVVEEDVAAPDAAVAVTDPLDPHRNPQADHLASEASPAAVAAAEQNEAAIRKAVGLDQSFASPDPAPTIAETLSATFDVAAPDAEPAFPADATETAAPVEADAEGGGTSTPPADADTSDDTTTTAPDAPADGS